MIATVVHSKSIRILLILSLIVLLSSIARADRIAIIGTGNVGSALGQRFGSLGHEIVYGSRQPDRAEVSSLVQVSGAYASARTQAAAVMGAEIVVLAVPWNIVEELVRSLGDLSGTIIIDPTNPRMTSEDGYRDYAFEGSNAERIQVLVPEAEVVKAFSTLGTETMLEPDSAGGPVSVPIAGDAADAKLIVAELASSIGLSPVDVGPLRFARVIEGLHFLRYNAGFSGPRFNYYLRPELE